jgi:hypothetical protein
MMPQEKKITYLTSAERWMICMQVFGRWHRNETESQTGQICDTTGDFGNYLQIQ